MKRRIDIELTEWQNSKFRKPLIIRGARQVGKTHSITVFGQRHFQDFAIFDFERDTTLHRIFEGDLDPVTICMKLEIHAAKRIVPGETLVFFDEIQACPRALLSLRYFYEQMPALHVIAAGSLLEFAMGDFSFPVGRVEFKWMRPLCFSEFLQAVDLSLYAAHLPNFSTMRPVDEILHEKMIEQLHRYAVVGGMPEAVSRYAKTRSLREVASVHQALCQAFTESLSKYRPRIDVESLRRIFEAVPNQVGSQIKYTRLDPESRVEKIKNILLILEQSLLICPIRSASAHGVPLGANASVKVFKCLFLDLGLMQYLSGANAGRLVIENRMLDGYKGALAEQFVGQQLLCHGQGSENGRLYYWSRARKSSSAEIDYLIVRNGKIIPIEVKSGPGGRLKSMQVFMKEHPDCREGLVLSLSNIKVDKRYRLRYLPLYALPEMV